MALLVRVYYNAVFGALGGLLGWMLFGVFGDRNPDEHGQLVQMLLGGALLGGLVGGCVFGLFYTLAIQAASTTYFWGAMGLVILGASIGSLSALVQGVFQPASVRVLRGWQEGREYPLDKPATLLGRDEHADIALFRDMKVEKKHAYIKRIGPRYLLVNNGAPPQFTLVNETPVAQSVELQ